MAPAAALPAPPTPLVGRAAELADVCRRLLDPGTRLVTLTGPPGVGKTRLALAVATQLAPGFGGGAAWVDLAPIRDPTLLTAEIGRALGIARTDDERGTARVVAALADREVLVVLDNCEHLLPAAPSLGSLLAAMPGLRVLATSRERLRLAAEREVVVAPLPVPADADLTDVAAVAANPAVSLLVARAPSHVTVTPRTVRALAEICVRLDGLPLALELAAARLRVFTPAELAFRLDRPMAVLTGGAVDAPDRHRGLRAAVEWSHGLLSDRERAVFRRLSVFVGPFTLAGGEAVCGLDGGVAEAIESLLDKSLLIRHEFDGDDAWFRMLVSLREYGAEDLDRCAESTATRARHVRYLADAAARWERTISTDKEGSVLRWLSLSRGDLLAAFGAAQADGDVDAMLRTATGLGWYWYIHGSLADAGRIVDVVGALVAESGVTSEAAAAAVLTAGVVAVGMGDLDSADALLCRAVEAAHARGDDRRRAIGEAFLGHAARLRHDLVAAAERYAAARRVYVELGSARGTAWAAHDLGLLAAEAGDAATAAESLREALQLFRHADYPWAAAVTASALAGVLLDTGEVAEAAGLLGDALQAHGTVGDRRGVAQALEGLAGVALARGSAATAARLCGAAAAHRDAVAAPPTAMERARLERVTTAAARILGAGEADRETRAGAALDPAAAVALGARLAEASHVPVVPAAEAPLTARQLEVTALIAAGSTNRQIARALGISEKTAEVHVRNIMGRLHVVNRAGVASWATAQGLVTTAAPFP